MKKIDRPIKNASRQFGVEELFFSTTDRRGVILTCNETFIRVGAYEPHELLNKPHNVIRHPDMPRCVFKLLWDYLLADKPIGAYVKNLAKTGEYYWVFALAAPVSEGFLSIRLKPTSGIFAQIPALYEKLLQTEAKYGDNWREGMIAATAELQATLKQLGFNSYDDFMCAALKAEIKSRDASLNRESNSVGNALENLFAMLDNLDQFKSELSEKEQFLRGVVENLSLTSINSSVRATRHGEEGRTLSAISSEIARVSSVIRQEMLAFDKNIAELGEALKATTFNAALARLQKEMSETFVAEGKALELPHADQLRRYGRTVDDLAEFLADRSEQLSIGAFRCVGSLRSVLYHFNVATDLFSKVVRTLKFAYVTGKTEASRMNDGAGYLHLLDELNAFTDQTEVKLGELEYSAIRTDQMLQTLY